MGRKFTDVMNGNDYILTAASDAFKTGSLPNGDSLWGHGSSAAIPPGPLCSASEVDLATGDWTIGLWFVNVGGPGTHNVLCSAYYPNQTSVQWAITWVSANTCMEFVQNQGDYSTVYRRRRNATAQGTSATPVFYMFTIPSGGTPDVYRNGLLDNSATNLVTPVGTPGATADRRLLIRFTGFCGMGKPFIFNRILDATDRAAIVNAMNAT